MPKTTIVIERWGSNKGNREDHYFVKNGKTSYLFGYNPKLISKKKVEQIVAIIDPKSIKHE